MITYRELLVWRAAEVQKAKDAGEPMFLGKPDKWYENVRWFCQNGHVSLRYLRTEGSDRCFACRKAVIMGPDIGEPDFSAVCQRIVGRRDEKV